MTTSYSRRRAGTAVSSGEPDAGVVIASGDASKERSSRRSSRREYSSRSRGTSGEPADSSSAFNVNGTAVSIVASLRDSSSIGSSPRKFSPTLPPIEAALAIKESKV